MHILKSEIIKIMAEFARDLIAEKFFKIFLKNFEKTLDKSGNLCYNIKAVRDTAK